jgi:LPS export ABC transporter protein LptC
MQNKNSLKYLVLSYGFGYRIMVFEFLLLLMLSLIPTFGNANQSDFTKASSDKIDLYSYPIQVEGLTLKEYHSGTSQREILTEHAVFAQGKKTVELNKSRFIFYDQQGKTKASLTCDKSQIDLQNNLVYISGNVRLQAQTGIQFQTEQLIWDTARKKFSTDAAVEIIKDNTIIHGKGLEADETFEQIQVRNFAAKGNQPDFTKTSKGKK